MKLISGTVFLRIAMGVTMCMHGVMKLIGGPAFWETLGGLPPLVPDHKMLQISLGVIATLIELLGGLMLVVGYRVREASLAIVVVMLIAFSYHFSNVNDFSSLMRNTWPLELALVYFSIALMHSKKTGA